MQLEFKCVSTTPNGDGAMLIPVLNRLSLANKAAFYKAAAGSLALQFLKSPLSLGQYYRITIEEIEIDTDVGGDSKKN